MRKVVFCFILIFSFSTTFGQTPIEVIRNNKVNYQICYWKSYENKKLKNIDTFLVYFDKNGYDTVISRSWRRDVILNTYDTLNRIIKRITIFEDGEKFDSTVYRYSSDGGYKTYVFYYDTTFKPIVKTFNQREQEIKNESISGKLISETFFDSLGRKLTTVIIQSNGKRIVQKENQTLDNKNRLYIDNKFSRGGSYDIYEYYDNGLLKNLRVYFDKAKTKWWDYVTVWFYY